VHESYALPAFEVEDLWAR